MIDIGITVNYMLFVKILFVFYIIKAVGNLFLGMSRADKPEPSANYGWGEFYSGCFQLGVVAIAILY